MAPMTNNNNNNNIERCEIGAGGDSRSLPLIKK